MVEKRPLLEVELRGRRGPVHSQRTQTSLQAARCAFFSSGKSLTWLSVEGGRESGRKGRKERDTDTQWYQMLTQEGGYRKTDDCTSRHT